jgi:hypothetical protein
VVKVKVIWGISGVLANLTGLRFLDKNSENEFPPENGRIEKVMVPFERAHQELSNEWSCQ